LHYTIIYVYLPPVILCLCKNGRGPVAKKTVQTVFIVILSNLVAEWYPYLELHQVIKHHHYGILQRRGG